MTGERPDLAWFVRQLAERVCTPDVVRRALDDGLTAQEAADRIVADLIDTTLADNPQPSLAGVHAES